MRKTLIRLLLQKQSDLGLHCLSRPIKQAACVQNIWTFTVPKEYDVSHNICFTIYMYPRYFFSQYTKLGNKIYTIWSQQCPNKKPYHVWICYVPQSFCISKHLTHCLLSVICWWPLQTVWTQIRPDRMLGLIWTHSVWHSDGISEIISQKS